MPDSVLEEYENFVSHFFEPIDQVVEENRAEKRISSKKLNKSLIGDLLMWESFKDETPELYQYFYLDKDISKTSPEYLRVQRLATDILRIFKRAVRNEKKLTSQQWDDWIYDRIIYFYDLSPILRKLISTQKAYEEIQSIVSETKFKSSDAFSDDTVEYLQFNLKGHEFSKSRFKGYTDKLISEIKKAKSQITIVSYEANQHAVKNKGEAISEQALKDYQTMNDIYAEYLFEVEKRIYEGISYKRISQIYYDKKRIRDKSIKRSNWINYSFDRMDDAMREHVKHFIKLQSKNPELKCSFHVLNAPLVPFSFIIIDDKCIITELIRWNKNGIPYPFELFINRVKYNNITALQTIDYRTKWLAHVLAVESNSAITYSELKELNLY